MFNSKVFVAEFIGTFALVFIGAGAGITGMSGLFGVAVAHGAVLAVFYYAFGHISGAHVNPAVTFGLALNGTVKWGEAVFYWIAQFAGGIVAAFTLNLAVGGVSVDGIGGGATIGVLTDSAPYAAALVEVILTFFLVNTILHTAVAGRGGAFAGLAIGLTLTFAILTGGAMTGASLNPARTFGPAIFTSPSLAVPMTYVIYLLGPLLGAALAVGVFKFLNSGETSESSAKKSTKR
ncbi:MAG: aquaporin [Anaerolineales bacterium]|nr:aquaporin [Anaerolineales bacterium]NUQ84339.1 aquaporin [Anaerolineales bacterium]